MEGAIMPEDGVVGFLFHTPATNGRVLTANENAVNRAAENLVNFKATAARGDLEKATAAILEAKGWDRGVVDDDGGGGSLDPDGFGPFG